MRRWISMIVFVLLVACEPIAEPEITIDLPAGVDIVPIGESWNDAGCNLLVDGEAREMTTTTTIDTDSLGETTVEYTIDYGIQTYRCYRVVKVIDTTAPSATLLPGIDTIQVGEDHIDAGIDIHDDVDEELDITIESTIDNTTPGTYSITYTVTDDFANETILVRIVTVRDDAQ